MKLTNPLKTVFCVLLIAMIASGCGLTTDDRINAKAVNQEIKNRKVIRITDKEKELEASSIAPLILLDMEPIFATIKNPCTASLPDTLIPARWRELNPEMRIVCQASQTQTDKEQNVWETYANALRMGESPGTNFQKLPNKSWLLSIPRLVDGRPVLLNIILNDRGLGKWVYMIKTKQKVSPAEQLKE